MEDLFPGYYRKTESEIKDIWKNGIILFDSNVLLNLYRYSESTRESLLNLIDRFSEQIYLPHQAALEYNKNRYEVIAEQEKAYYDFLKKINSVQEDLQSTSRPPFITVKVDENLSEILNTVKDELNNSIEKFSNYLQKDPVYDRISLTFINKITESFTDDILKEIYIEGAERYKLKIPPGFEDEKTKNGNEKYGDLVLWKQVIELAKKLKRDVLLVTDDGKIDWWWKLKNGKIMGPRHELVEEIKDLANINFHMYSPESFLRYGLNFFDEVVNQGAVEEIEAMKKADFEKSDVSNYYFLNLKTDFEKALESMDIRKEIQDIDHELRALDKSEEKLTNKSLDDVMIEIEVQEHLDFLNNLRDELDKKKKRLLIMSQYLNS